MKALLALALTAASSWAVAQPYAPPRPATIQVTGQAKVSETPDRVYIDIGVTTRERESEAAASQNAARVSAVIAAVKRVGGPAAQLTTTRYSMTPDYNYPRDGGAPAITGYTASNVVQVRLDDLRRVGAVIDAATQAGSNNVQDIRFALRDDEAPRAQALRQAALSARRDAEALAQALGLRIVRVISAREQSPEVGPVALFKRSVVAAPAAATPVQAGAIEVSASLTLTVEVAPAKR